MIEEDHMKKHINLLIFISLFILSSCGTVNSSYHYKKGTKCLEEDNYEKAITHLKKAVELNPDRAINHTNLAAAYVATGQMDNAWIECRNGIKAKHSDKGRGIFFASFYQMYVTERGIDKIGNPRSYVEIMLGKPDMILGGNHYVYGSSIICFHNDLISDVQSFFNAENITNDDGSIQLPEGYRLLTRPDHMKYE